MTFSAHSTTLGLLGECSKWNPELGTRGGSNNPQTQPALCKDRPVIAALNLALFCSVISFLLFVTWQAAPAILMVAGITPFAC